MLKLRSGRCLELWSRPDDELKESYLFSRQFLGIGTAVPTARRWPISPRWEQKA